MMIKTETNGFENYKTLYQTLMTEWAEKVRNWTHCGETARFYIDGIFDPETWFANDFRPLFVLKEVNEQNEENAEKEAREIWGIKNCINFVGINNEGNDPWNGEWMWRRIGFLARALFDLHERQWNSDGFLERCYNFEENTEQNEHRDIIKKIAVINLKKLAGGGSTVSDKSKKTLCFECHAEYFHNELIEQIQLINPTVIICCGIDSVIECLGVKKNKNNKEYEKTILIGTNKISVINSFHPSRNSKEKFYNQIFKEIGRVKFEEIIEMDM